MENSKPSIGPPRTLILKYRLKQYAEKSTIHGLLDLYLSSNCSLLFWGIFMTIALSMSIHGCYAIMIEYMTRPIATAYVRAGTTSIQLPDLVICPFSRFRKQFFEHHMIPDDLADFIESGFIGVRAEFYGFKDKAPRWMGSENDLESRLLDLQRQLNMTLMELINNASHDCKSIIKYCRTPYHMYRCCSSEYMQYIFTMQGRCLRVNGTIQDMGGYGSGMTIGMRLPYDRYRPSYNTFHNNGTLVALVDREMEMGSNIFMIPDGVHALMPIRITQYKFTNDPPRYMCKQIAQGVPYSALQCFDNCFMQTAKSTCNCTTWNLPDDKYRFCSPSEVYNCALREIDRTFNEFIAANRSLVKICRNQCIQPCTYREHTATISYTQFPSKTYKKLLGDEVSDIIENDIILDYFYDKFEYTLIEHIPTMTTHQLIGNLGGQLSLWIGASIVSIIQILSFFLTMCFKESPPSRDDHTDQSLEGDDTC